MSAKRLYETLDDGKSSIPVSRAQMESLPIRDQQCLNNNAPNAVPWEDRIWVRVTGVTSPILKRLYPDKAAKP
jgi:hypothetical protein